MGVAQDDCVDSGFLVNMGTVCRPIVCIERVCEYRRRWPALRFICQYHNHSPLDALTQAIICPSPDAAAAAGVYSQLSSIFLGSVSK